ncbi:hypothetical protein CTEN210_06813 [Chaetoceros tenuissimus]|uniref:Ubiquitin-like domain-containing protein n=1 Tax=Chaetoceros tenuissimus TaxID=426638 RepID=A0AAD3CQK1_9STRA|nr:hypothetical protein CTEN210_06813 [Chaetoceros tenuissimus]
MATDLTQIVEQILSSHDLDYLSLHYIQHGMATPFHDAKKHYIGYLLATIAAESFKTISNIQLSPPLHVDVLWHGHLLETKRWRVFEKLVIEKYKESGRQTDIEHIDHSVVDNLSGRKERLQQTRSFYEVLGLEFKNDDDNKNASVIDLDSIEDRTLSGDKRERTEQTINKDREKRRKKQTEKTARIRGRNQEEEIREKAQEEASERIAAFIKEEERIKADAKKDLEQKNMLKEALEKIRAKAKAKKEIEQKNLLKEIFEKARLQRNGMIRITVRDYCKEEIVFKVQKTTKSSKIINAYAERRGIDPESVRLLYYGQRIFGETMQEVGVEDQEQLDMILEQGGC